MVLSESEKNSTASKENEEEAPNAAPSSPSPSPQVDAVEEVEVKGQPEDNNKGQPEVRTEMLKHPLQNTWTLWYLEHDGTKAWEELQNEITSFDTVEDFWSLYNHIKPPSDINLGCDYSLFKKGIRPMWEDPANKQGGRWIITLKCASKTDLDTLWLDVLLCLIGEAFEHSDQICGAVVNMRRFPRISVWTGNGSNEVAAMEIGHKLRDSLRLGNQSLQYQLHQDTMVKTGSHVKSIYTI